MTRAHHQEIGCKLVDHPLQICHSLRLIASRSSAELWAYLAAKFMLPPSVIAAISIEEISASTMLKRVSGFPRFGGGVIAQRLLSPV